MNSSVLLLCAFLFATTSVLGQSSSSREMPVLTSPVYDEANILTPQEKLQLENKLRAYEDSTSTQIVVVLLNDLGGQEISDYATKVGRENKVGQSKKNNGAIIMISQNPRKAWIATGYGLEASLTDLETGLIYREVLRPGLQAGNFYQALDRTTDALMAATAGEFKGDVKASRTSDDSPSTIGVVTAIVIFFVALTVLRALFGRGHRRTIVGSRHSGSGCMGGILQALFWSTLFSGRGGGGWGGSSGGFGGFGGGGGGWSGGGGSFGGGGAGGDW